MSVYVNWLTELSEAADLIIFESYVEHEKAVQTWLNLVKENVQAIVYENPTDSSSAGCSTYTDISSCVSLVKSRTEIKSNEKRERVSRVLSGIQKDTLHLKRASTRLNKSLKELCDKSLRSVEREIPTKGSSKEFTYKTPNKKYTSSTPIEQTQLQQIPVINQDKKKIISVTPQRRTSSKSPTYSQQEKSSKRKSSNEFSNYTKKTKVKTSSFSAQKHQVLLQQTAKTLELDTREKREREKKREVCGASTTKTLREATILRNIQKKQIVSQNENLKKVIALQEGERENKKREREEKTKKSHLQCLKLEKEKEREGRLKERTRAAHVEKTDLKHRVPVQNSEGMPSKAGVSKPIPAKKGDVCDKKTVSAKTISVSTHDMNRTYSTRPSNSGKPNKEAIKAKHHTPSKQLKSKITVAPASTSLKKSESYAMTPATTSFVSYDISEINSDDSDEEEAHNSKPVPAWASGVRLRNALLQQHYHPIDTEKLFGNDVPQPDLEVIMGVKKKQYKKRTSSAIWNTTFT